MFHPRHARLALVMIRARTRRLPERCLASGARGWTHAVLDTARSTRASPSPGTPGPRRALRLDRRLRRRRNAALAHSAAAWNLVSMPTNGSSTAGRRWPRCAPTGDTSRGPFVSGFDSADGRVTEAPSWLPRVLPQGVRYEGRIHEQPGSALPRRRLALVVGHDGYRDAQKAAKAGRNERLLRLALAADPEDPYLHYQLGKDLELQARFARPRALRQGAGALRRPGRVAPHLVLRYLFTMKQLQRFEAAIALADRDAALAALARLFFPSAPFSAVPGAARTRRRAAADD